MNQNPYNLHTSTYIELAQQVLQL